MTSSFSLSEQYSSLLKTKSRIHSHRLVTHSIGRHNKQGLTLLSAKRALTFTSTVTHPDLRFVIRTGCTVIKYTVENLNKSGERRKRSRGDYFKAALVVTPEKKKKKSDMFWSVKHGALNGEVA